MTQKKFALLLMATMTFAHGIFMMWARSYPHASADILFPFLVMELFVGMLLIFVWLRGDEVDYRYRHSAATNIGIVALALVFIPVYLCRSRPRGQRAKIIGLFFLCLLASLAIAVTGGIVGAVIFGLPKM